MFMLGMPVGQLLVMDLGHRTVASGAMGDDNDACNESSQSDVVEWCSWCYVSW